MNLVKLLVVGFLLVGFFHALPSIALDVPPALEPWKPWVLHDKESQTCPPRFDDGAIRRCWWPARLDVDAGNRGATFDMQVTVYAPTWVTLPGGGVHWPESVTSGKQPLPVVARNERPAVWLATGQYRIHGAMVWNRLPEMLPVPSAVGLVTLTIDGTKIVDPDRDGQGTLRLQGRSGVSRREGTFSATVFRLIEDDIPMRVVTRILLQVSGRPREIRLEDLLPHGGAVMKTDGPLPVRLDGTADLLVQARPGRWDVRVTVRMTGPVDRLKAGQGDYGREIWSFKAYNHLRMVNVSGAPTVEPTRTQMPDEWKGLPAYQLQPGAALAFETVRRGDPDPAPDQLELQRTWWLDFDGSGFTLHDRLSGTLSRTWHLAMQPPVELGRVAVDGQDQLITRQGDLPGVQLRHGQLALEADSRMSRISAAIPAVGWDHDFNRVAGTLNLPPGWTLFSAGGVDIPADAWLQRWTLLDLFIVLIVAISAWKIRSRSIGCLVLATLVLTFHEPNAPRYVWLHLVAAAALLKTLPEGWFKKIIRLWGSGAVIALIVMALPFMVQQIRKSVYPQLDYPASRVVHRTVAPQPSALMEERMESVVEPSLKGRSTVRTLQHSADAIRSTAPPKIPRQRLDAKDPEALIQTGPGLPDWRWRRVPLRWNGPVDRSQTVRLVLISPLVNLLLGVSRVALLFILIAAIIIPRSWLGIRSTATPSAAAALLLAFLILFSPSALRAESTGDAFPPQMLLDQLQRRLLAAPDCLPACADISRLELAVTPDQIRLILQIHVLAETAIPLPAGRQSWIPDRIVLNNEPVKSFARDDRGMLWMVVPEGVHQLKLTGMPGPAEEVRISLPLRPHAATYAGVGWRAQGIHADGTVDASIVLTRIRDQDAPQRPAPQTDIAPFFQVFRTLHLGIQWEAITRVRRLTAVGTPAVLSVPLLKGAAVTTPGVRVKAGFAQVALGPDEVETRYTSILPIKPTLRLTAPQKVPWTEVWTLDAAVIWDCTVSGLTVVHHQDAGRHWQPQWRPWPGEQVSIAIDRPAAIPGQTITVDNARLETTPGRRITRSVLDLRLRSSQGGHHQIELPSHTNLQAVTVNGQSLPIRQDGQLVTIPLHPGNQSVQVEWQRLTDSLMHIKSPLVNVGQAAVNGKVTLRMPDQRWILFAGGPTMGPAVLFWSYGILAVLIALGLGKIDITPLRTHHWLLLALGLTQVPAPVAVLVAGWLLALGYRCRKTMPGNTLAFNLIQLILGVATLAALAGLYTAIERGLLGIPDMQIAGNHSTRLQLNWTQDRIDGILPTPWAVSLPLWIYRLLMLAWSLWLAFSLVAWLRWGWGCFSKERLWKPVRLRRKTRPVKAESREPDSAAGPPPGKR